MKIINCVTDDLVFTFESENQARSYFNCTPRDALSVLLEWNCSAAVVRYPGGEVRFPLAAIKLMASSTPFHTRQAVNLFFADCSLPASVVQAALNQPGGETRWGVVRILDGRQVLMSSGMSGVLLAGVGIEETTSWTREASWNPAILSDFTRDWRQQLSLEENRSIEYRYQIRKPGTQDPWTWYRSSFRLLQGEDGILYHLGVYIDHEG